MPTAAIAASSSGSNTVVAAPTDGRYISVLGWTKSANGTVNAKWQSASTDKTGLYYMNQFASVSVPISGEAQFDCAANEPLVLNLSGAVAVGGHVKYVLRGLAS